MLKHNACTQPKHRILFFIKSDKTGIFDADSSFFYPDNQAKAYPGARSRGRSRRLLRGYSPEGRVCAKHKSGHALSRIGVSNSYLLQVC